ncbi:MAG: L,D-transpeptidase [Deltaproteobacteria bacterium]|nr:L,D-transpeptidase [Deltaproteobacteria bacterium]
MPDERPSKAAPQGAKSICLILLLSSICLAVACSKLFSSKQSERQKPVATAETSGLSADTHPDSIEEKKRLAEIEKNFPLHGLVTGIQLKVTEQPHSESIPLGWLRIGSRIRLAKQPTKSSTCASGWYRVYPFGWACAGQGIEIGTELPDSTFAVTPAPQDAALPYSYYFVKEPFVPEYHRLPSRDEQRAALGFANRYLELEAKNRATAEKFLRGELSQEAKSPTVVRRYLERGFYIAGADQEMRAFRQFVRTVQGSYIKLAQLEERRGSGFHGVELGEQLQLPVAWAVRSARAFTPKQRDDGSFRFVADESSEPFERLAILPWEGWERFGESVLHRLKNGRYLKFWFAAVAERIDRPKEIGDREPWIHVDLSQQTLVLYRGSMPLYATLVSTGLQGYDTPVGLFEIRSKHIADTMSDLGPEAGDERYKIEDVPWTQYFKGSLAIHGAFWHERFGLRRSHGCINLAPLDAHYVFNQTWPELPAGWHGISTDNTDLRKSKIVITD